MSSILELINREAVTNFFSCFWPLVLLGGLFLSGAILRTWPTVRTLAVFILSALFSLAMQIFNAESGIRYVMAFDVILIIILTIDLGTVVFLRSFKTSRKTERIASLGRPHLVQLRIENRSRSNRFFLVSDDVQFGLNNTEGLFEQSQFLSPNEALELEYRFTPNVRGEYILENIWLQIFSILNFWKKEVIVPERTEIHVYPDLRQLSQYEILARTQHLEKIGVRRIRRTGQDSDFERLRDYTEDDQYKFMDWKSTARRNKLTVRDFQMTRSQRLVFMIDSGRLMMNQTCGLSFLDHSLNAMLMLSYIALKQGDEVGLLVFAGDIRSFMPPRSGLNYLNHLIYGCYNIFAEPEESRYDNAFSYLAARCRKRSLTIFISNIIDERNSLQIETHLQTLTGRHLPLGVFLRDHSLFDPLSAYSECYDNQKAHPELTADSQKTWIGRSTKGSQTDPKIDFSAISNQTLCRAGAAAEILGWRHRVIQSLRTRGTLTLDLFPEDLTAPLINKYLEIKARHLL